MFTGIVEEIGTVRRMGGNQLLVSAEKVVGDLTLGDSVAVNGVCLTVVSFGSDSFTIEVMPETLRRTNLGALRVGDRVNLERALKPTSRLGGHFVQGHVDGTGKLTSVRPEGDALVARISAQPAIMRYVVEKGFISVDGVSLTVVDCGEGDFSVSLVGFTQRNIVLPQKRAGDMVNLEVDILGKYVEKLVKGSINGSKGTAGISEEFLARQGFM